MSARKSRKTNSTQHNKKTESKATNALQKQNNNNNSQLTNSAVDVFTADMGKKMHYQLGICVGDCETQ